MAVCAAVADFPMVCVRSPGKLCWVGHAGNLSPAGPHFVISFAVGAAIANVTMLVFFVAFMKLWWTRSRVLASPASPGSLLVSLLVASKRQHRSQIPSFLFELVCVLTIFVKASVQ